jgi:hypothetical protein
MTFQLKSPSVCFNSQIIAGSQDVAITIACSQDGEARLVKELYLHFFAVTFEADIPIYTSRDRTKVRGTVLERHVQQPLGHVQQPLEKSYGTIQNDRQGILALKFKVLDILSTFIHEAVLPTGVHQFLRTKAQFSRARSQHRDLHFS